MVGVDSSVRVFGSVFAWRIEGGFWRLGLRGYAEGKGIQRAWE